jgi:cytochrome c oxidase accessory protein FixG
MREQVCTTICPYGRMQSVLLDENSLTVAYDFVRGEPRGKLGRKQKKTVSTENFIDLKPIVKGDCVDCNLCVQVCPTGIDIRHGTQLECVNCTACMDACDEVMLKINKPKGLIRLDSYNNILNGGRSKLWNGRAMAYTIVLLALIGLEVFLFSARSEIEVLFLRTPGMLYDERDEGYIRNLYNYQLINKSNRDIDVTFEVEGKPYIIFELVGKLNKVLKNDITEGAVFIKIPTDQVDKSKTKLSISVKENGEIIDETKTTFLGPIK